MRRYSHVSRLMVATSVAVVGVLGFAVEAGASGTGFTSGDFVVYEVTETSGAPSSTAGAVTLVDYSTAGVASGYSVSMPTADSGSGAGSTHRLVESGSATNDGDLTLSADGQYLYATGYDDPVGTAKITSVTPAPPRTVAILPASGSPDTSTAFTDTTTEAQNFRSATGATGGSSNFYNGGGAGVGYTADAASTNSFIDAGDATHEVQISNDNLFESTSSNIYQLGTGLPTGTVTPTAVIPSALLPSGFNANGFAFVTLGSGSAPDTLYVADTGKNAVEKYAYNSSTGLVTAAEGSVTVDDPTGLVVNVGSSGAATIYFTNGVSSNTFATQISDISDGSGATGTLASNSTVATLVTAGSTSSFHGLAWAPTAPTMALPESPLVIALPALAIALLGGSYVITNRRRYRLTAS